jgi:hypothetical protein
MEKMRAITILPGYLHFYLITTSRLLGLTYSIADPGCLSRILDPNFFPFRIPDPGKKKAVGKSSGMFISDPDLIFLPILDPGVKKAPDP